MCLNKDTQTTLFPWLSLMTVKLCDIILKDLIKLWFSKPIYKQETKIAHLQDKITLFLKCNIYRKSRFQKVWFFLATDKTVIYLVIHFLNLTTAKRLQFKYGNSPTQNFKTLKYNLKSNIGQILSLKTYFYIYSYKLSQVLKLKTIIINNRWYKKFLFFWLWIYVCI